MWIVGAAPLNSFPTERLVKSAKLHRPKVVPTFALTRAAFRNAFGSRKGDLRDRTRWQRVVRLKLALPAFIHDVGRSLYHLTRMALAKTHLRIKGMWAWKDVLEDFLVSFLISLKATLIILFKLGLKTLETLHQQIQDGDLDVFMGLARVLEAFASRFAAPGTIYLASGKTLSREYCPDVALGHFDHIHDLKDNSSFADFLRKHIPDMVAFEEWLPSVMTVFKGSDRDHRLPWDVLRALRRVRTQLPYMIFWHHEMEKYKAMPSRIAPGEVSR